MKKFTITFLLIMICLAPIQASAMSSNNMLERRYEQALLSIINLLMQRVEALMFEIQILKAQQNQIQVTVQAPAQTQAPAQIEPEKTTPPVWVRPNSNYTPATGGTNRCHSSAIDIKVGDKDCK